MRRSDGRPTRSTPLPFCVGDAGRYSPSSSTWTPTPRARRAGRRSTQDANGTMIDTSRQLRPGKDGRDCSASGAGERPRDLGMCPCVGISWEETLPGLMAGARSRSVVLPPTRIRRQLLAGRTTRKGGGYKKPGRSAHPKTAPARQEWRPPWDEYVPDNEIALATHAASFSAYNVRANPNSPNLSAVGEGYRRDRACASSHSCPAHWTETERATARTRVPEAPPRRVRPRTQASVC